MRYLIIENELVTNIVVADPEIAKLQGWTEAPQNAEIGWKYNGSIFIPPPTNRPDLEQIKQKIITSTQNYLDKFAQTRGYYDINSASTYAGCSVPKFDIEGTYCRDIRAQTWTVLYSILANVESGVLPIPLEFSEIESLLPVLEWPT